MLVQAEIGAVIDISIGYSAATGQLALEVDLNSLGAPMANGHGTAGKSAHVKAAAQKRGAGDGTTARSKAAASERGTKGTSKAAKDPAAEMRERQLQQESVVCPTWDVGHHNVCQPHNNMAMLPEA